MQNIRIWRRIWIQIQSNQEKLVCWRQNNALNLQVWWWSYKQGQNRGGGLQYKTYLFLNLYEMFHLKGNFPIALAILTKLLGLMKQTLKRHFSFSRKQFFFDSHEFWIQIPLQKQMFASACNPWSYTVKRKVKKG